MRTCAGTTRTGAAGATAGTWASTWMRRAPASIAFSTSSLTTDAGRYAVIVPLAVVLTWAMPQVPHQHYRATLVQTS